MATVRLLSLHWHLLEASALNTLGAILDFINLRRALPLVTKIRLGIAISTLVSPNRHEPLTEPGDILLDNVRCLLLEPRSILSAARVPRQFEFLSLEFPIQPWVRIVIVNDLCKTCDSRAKNELIKFKHSSNGICECATTGKLLQVTGDHSALTYFFSYIFPLSLTIVLVSFVIYYQAKWWDHYTWLYSGKGNAYTWPITIGKDGEWQGGDRTSDRPMELVGILSVS